MSYGQQVFRVCVATILTGAKLGKELKLSSLLMTNQERFERICRTLNDKEKSPQDCILATGHDIGEIEEFRFVSEKGINLELLIGVAKLMIVV